MNIIFKLLMDVDGWIMDITHYVYDVSTVISLLGSQTKPDLKFIDQ